MMRAGIGFVLSVAAAIGADGQAVLWRDPGPAASLDLAGGPGGRDKAPQAPFTFLKEDPAGTSPKISVRDARGVTWSVKFGPEVKAESFATRFVWAAGYFAETTYYVPEGTVDGANSLARAGAFIRNGKFRDARFELRDESAYRLVEPNKWFFDDPGVKGSKELAGLKLTIMLLSNWDIKRENTGILEAGGQRYYVLTDWGASMGVAQDRSGRSKWDCEGFAKQSQQFVQEVGDGFVTLNYSGKERQVITTNIRVEDVKWYMDRMSKLADTQIRAGLQAAGATPQEASCFTQALGKRLGQLVTVATGEWDKPGTTTTRTRTITKKTTTIVEDPPKQ
jgi:hypothetical protein